ncbi:hypothetical protein [Pseudomonas syringae]|uniref:hypothetical protein n=1 Tax=Pseudomonas syringae TaxID=317 RepID=UPI0015A74D60|nr:hypothetical protein [Pseudomonas syringae]
MLALLLTLVSGVKDYLLYGLLPHSTTFQALTRFIELAEHCPMIAKASVDLQATRNRFTPLKRQTSDRERHQCNPISARALSLRSPPPH